MRCPKSPPHMRVSKARKGHPGAHKRGNRGHAWMRGTDGIVRCERCRIAQRNINIYLGDTVR